MKFNKVYLNTAISSIALVIVLIIQVNWILETARIKEELFNEKANMVLLKTTEALTADKPTCNNIKVEVGARETRVIDSLFNHYMDVYDFQVDYYFEVKPSQYLPSVNMNQAAYYRTFAEQESGTNSLGLKLVIPNKEQFIIDEMGPMFITSVSLILVVLVLSWSAIISLFREKQISERSTEFLNNMTHEFKTPLTNIALAGKMIIREGNISQQDKVRHYSGIILGENEKLRHQVEQVLSMTALERGEIPVKKINLDVHQIIIEALKSISIQVESRQGKIEESLGAEHFIVAGDKIHLANAVSNLLDNAVKYSDAIPEITIKTYNRDSFIFIEVGDKGIGIEKEHQHKIFDTYYRVPTGDQHDVKGFGLGLAYTKKIINLHGGTITMDSEKGKGTTFTITLNYEQQTT